MTTHFCLDQRTGSVTVGESGVDNEQLTQKGRGAIPARDQRTGGTGQNRESLGDAGFSKTLRAERSGNDHGRAVVESQLGCRHYYDASVTFSAFQ